MISIKEKKRKEKILILRYDSTALLGVVNNSTSFFPYTYLIEDLNYANNTYVWVTLL